MALAQRSMENHGGPLLPFSAGGREERKKNNLANFPSRTRALGQPPCETDVLPHFRVFSRLFALQSGRRIKGASTFIGTAVFSPASRNNDGTLQVHKLPLSYSSPLSYISRVMLEEEGGGGHRHAESDRAFGGAGKNPACTSSHHVKSGFISR
ncbi:hypothetical protein ALC57_14344 [Trachymyrmex cornetzi]|uniref:Uncharacterized protein n=1 Tax=Trachymyrmex cornetzi TaxID=471704 RepID=A0A195DKE8_9HYME|nr:hypothetical protein ALC57_14344 [Trachymyrmex cornetzi]